MTEKTETIQAKHLFTEAERLALTDQLTAAMREEDSITDQLASVKAEFKRRLEKAEIDKKIILQKVTDKFEMRPTLAKATFDHPTPGRKSYFAVLHQGDDGSIELGSFIREEAMSAADFEPELPLTGEQTTEATDAESAGVNLDHHPEVGDSKREISETRDALADAGQSIGTSFADKLTVALQGAEVAPVEIEFPANYGADKYRALWRKAAKKQEWPEAAIDLIDGIALETQHDSELGKSGCAQRVLDVLKAHSVAKS